MEVASVSSRTLREKETAPLPPARRRGRPTAAETRERIDHLLNVTARIFTTEGYEAATTRHIAQSAGISEKSIYSWFPDKVALFTEMSKRLTARLSTLEDDLPMRADLSLEDALYALAKRMMNDLLRPESVAILRFLQKEGDKYPEFTAIIRESHLNVMPVRIRALLELHQSNGNIPKINLDSAPLLFFHLAYSEIRHSVTYGLELPNPEQVGQHARNVAALFAHGLSGLSATTPVKKASRPRAR
jgi:TetR/AcrR family transcriptional repressor of mexJK operon